MCEAIFLNMHSTHLIILPATCTPVCHRQPQSCLSRWCRPAVRPASLLPLLPPHSQSPGRSYQEYELGTTEHGVTEWRVNRSVIGITRNALNVWGALCMKTLVRMFNFVKDFVMKLYLNNIKCAVRRGEKNMPQSINQQPKEMRTRSLAVCTGWCSQK